MIRKGHLSIIQVDVIGHLTMWPGDFLLSSVIILVTFLLSVRNTQKKYLKRKKAFFVLVYYLKILS